ncbi:ABC transporter permease [Actinoplanes teichomyceticus]|uniref:Sulfonate transport system permease protein n=1 Tax=Actinoplanes teichomyceticus TaxID=1867 RepID=A0A561WAH3_ACTTI|nr:ABC transporter permease [Actinoplanes teichomyceticus]TWG20858.1 sulfonate transport system permease protein [Actinoplanes teichomyceticus]GIF14519.1 ABC transporter permease [Actinoplanes teichomyceticus]
MATETLSVATRPRSPASPARRARRRLGPGRPIPYGRLLGPALLVAIWAAASATGLLDPRKLSAPWTVAGTAADLISTGALQDNILASLERAVSGFLIGAVIGTALALLAGTSRIGEALIDGPMRIKLAIPTIGLIPLLILWLGINEGFKITIIAVAVAVYMYIQVFAGLTGIDQRYVELAQVQNYSRWEFLRHVVFPGALPGFFVGLRLAVTASWLILITVEQINALSGVGYMMSQAQLYAQTDIIVVGLVVYGIFGFASDALVRFTERRVLGWRRTLTS